MSEYAWIMNGAVQQIAAFEAPPEPLAPEKGAWLPVSEDPAISPAHTAINWEICADRVVKTWVDPMPASARIMLFRDALIAQLSEEFERRANAPISFEVSGVVYDWGGDAAARENILGVVVLISAGVPIDNPRPWTPHRSMTPVMLSHVDLIGLGAALAARKDALYVHKKTVLSALLQAQDMAALNDIAVLTGWPEC